MSQTNVVNKTDNIKKEKSSKSNNKTRHLTALVILACIIPFTVFAGLNPILFSRRYDYAFIGLLGILFLYGIFEINNFVFGKKRKEFNQNFYLISFLYLGAFVFWGIEFVDKFNPEFSNGANLLTTDNNFFLLIFLTLFVISILYLLYSSFYPTDIKDHLTIITVSLLLFAFFTSIYLILMLFNWTFFYLFILMITVIDTSAYFGGKKFGKHKLAPVNSPNKTIEGAGFGSLMGIIFAFAWFFVLIYPKSLNNLTYISSFENFYNFWTIFAIFALIMVIAIFEPLADITLSKIKRSYGKKDFSNILPGHGGLLDRIDTHIFTIIISNLFLMILIL